MSCGRLMEEIREMKEGSRRERSLREEEKMCARGMTGVGGIIKLFSLLGSLLLTNTMSRFYILVLCSGVNIFVNYFFLYKFTKARFVQPYFYFILFYFLMLYYESYFLCISACFPFAIWSLCTTFFYWWIKMKDYSILPFWKGPACIWYNFYAAFT